MIEIPHVYGKFTFDVSYCTYNEMYYDLHVFTV